MQPSTQYEDAQPGTEKSQFLAEKLVGLDYSKLPDVRTEQQKKLDSIDTLQSFFQKDGPYTKSVKSPNVDIVNSMDSINNSRRGIPKLGTFDDQSVKKGVKEQNTGGPLMEPHPNARKNEAQY